mgnify:CR=1 FL=1
MSRIKELRASFDKQLDALEHQALALESAEKSLVLLKNNGILPLDDMPHEFNPERGWIGMTWPKKYGGQERSYMERYVVTEEMRAIKEELLAQPVLSFRFTGSR